MNTYAYHCSTPLLGSNAHSIPIKPIDIYNSGKQRTALSGVIKIPREPEMGTIGGHQVSNVVSNRRRSSSVGDKTEGKVRTNVIGICGHQRAFSLWLHYSYLLRNEML